jgi:hypothetical protein
MDELPRRFGEAEGPAENVMKPIRLEETRTSGLDDYLIDPKVSLLSKTPNRQPLGADNRKPADIARSPIAGCGLAMSLRMRRNFSYGPIEWLSRALMYGQSRKGHQPDVALAMDDMDAGGRGAGIF